MEISLTLSTIDAGQHKFRRVASGRRASLLVGALIAIGVLATAGEYLAASPSSEASIGATTQAVFSGEFVDGVPVYRLPPITVVARRGSLPGK